MSLDAGSLEVRLQVLNIQVSECEGRLSSGELLGPKALDEMQKIFGEARAALGEVQGKKLPKDVVKLTKNIRRTLDACVGESRDAPVNTPLSPSHLEELSSRVQRCQKQLESGQILGGKRVKEIEATLAEARRALEEVREDTLASTDVEHVATLNEFLPRGESSLKKMKEMGRKAASNAPVWLRTTGDFSQFDIPARLEKPAVRRLKTPCTFCTGRFLIAALRGDPIASRETMNKLVLEGKSRYVKFLATIGSKGDHLSGFAEIQDLFPELDRRGLSGTAYRLSPTKETFQEALTVLHSMKQGEEPIGAALNCGGGTYGIAFVPKEDGSGDEDVLVFDSHGAEEVAGTPNAYCFRFSNIEQAAAFLGKRFSGVAAGFEKARVDDQGRKAVQFVITPMMTRLN